MTGTRVLRVLVWGYEDIVLGLGLGLGYKFRGTRVLVPVLRVLVPGYKGISSGVRGC